jgi:hypothetical protein
MAVLALTFGVMAATVVVSCGKDTEKLMAQLTKLKDDSYNAYYTDGNTEEAARLAQEALNIAKELQKAGGQIEAEEMAHLESEVETYTAKLAEEKTAGRLAPEGDFEVKLDEAGTGAVITKYTGPGGNIIIPSTIQGMPVTWVNMNPPMQKVEIGRHTEIQNAIKPIYSIEDIEAADKYYDEEFGKEKVVIDYTDANTTLLSVVIPDGVKAVGGFEDCIALRSVTIPGSVSSYWDGAFSGCTSLTSVTISNGVPWIGKWMFNGCTSLTSITLPDSVTKIGDEAFGGCTGLVSINIPDGVKEIGEGAFGECTSLVALSIPDGVTSINARTFDGCTSLVTVTISPIAGRSLYGNAFANCPKLSLASQAAIKAAGGRL